MLKKVNIFYVLLLIPLVTWSLYILLHDELFKINNNISKNVRMELVEQKELDHEDLEYKGVLKPRQEIIQEIELRFREINDWDEVSIDLEKDNKVVASYLGNSMKSKSLIWKENIEVKQGENYDIHVKLYSSSSKVKDARLKLVQVRYKIFFREKYLLALSLSIGSILILFINIFCGKKTSYNKIETKITFLPLCCLAVNALFSFWVMEYIFQNNILKYIEIKYIINSWFLYFLFYLILLLIMNSIKAAAVAGNIFFLIWGLANQYVYLFKGQVLQPIDLKSIRTAADVALEYDYSLTMEMVVAISVVLFVTTGWVCSKKRKIIIVDEEIKDRGGYQKTKVLKTEKVKHRKKRIGLLGAGCFCTILFYCFLMYTTYVDNLSMSLDMWNTQISCQKYGIALSFVGYWKEMQVERPENYSVKNIEKLKESFYEQNQNSEQKKEDKNSYSNQKKANVAKPNIITVMNEAFADLSYLGEFDTNIPYLEYYNSLNENTIKGYTLVSIIGGGTPDSEFEYLTGHTLGFLPGSIPFTQYIQEDHYSMAVNLKAQGYATTAIHLMQKKNWRRNIVYPYLGFDKFISIEDVEEEELDRVRNYPSDKATYQEILKTLNEKEKDKPAFIFSVTVQNHSGYVYEEENYKDEVQVIGFDSPEVNQYLTLIRKSDEAIKELIEELKEYEEPTILVFFGDHYPGLPDEFYRWVMGENYNQSYEMIQKRFSVPFFIWANYDIKEENNVFTSLNYLGANVLKLAGVELSDYDKYRLDLSSKIPAVNSNGYIDQKGNYHSMQEENSFSEILGQYWIIEYNEMFDEKNRLDDFFGVS